MGVKLTCGRDTPRPYNVNLLFICKYKHHLLVDHYQSYRCEIINVEHLFFTRPGPTKDRG